MDDFIFGTLATDELRLKRIRDQRAGITHNHARLPRDPAPGQPVTLTLSVGPAYRRDRAWVYWTASAPGEPPADPAGQGGVASQGQVIPMQWVHTEWDTLLWGYVRIFNAEIPGQPEGSIVRYRIGTASSEDPASPEIWADNGAFYAYYAATDPLPAWAAQAVIYQIFVDRFYPGSGKDWLRPKYPSGFYGGTLAGITEKMDYIAGLGITTLWLTPVFPSPSHHGYDATDLFEIEPRLGDKDDLKRLLDEAHARNLRVLLDFVPNHWSSGHATFQQAISDPHSPYRDWYSFKKWPSEYETFFGVKDLPQVNLRFPAARQAMLDAAAYWLDFGVDGYRVDYAIGPTPDFWADFRRVTRQAQPDCWTFGEVVDPPDVQLSFEGLLDGCLDFNLLEAIRQTFAFGRWGAPRFADFLSRHEAYFPASFSRPSFLDNHDMNRFLWAAGGDQARLRLAALCQFTLSGPPVIYYGTEVGLSQERDVRQGRHGLPEESRLPMPWDGQQDAGLLAYYRSLISMRRSAPALHGGSWQALPSGEQLLAYSRQHQGENWLAAMNLTNKPARMDLDGAWKKIVLSTGPGCIMKPGSGGVHIILPPLGGLVAY